MLQELKKEANYTLTENGALTYASTMDHCLDLFATAGGLRDAGEEEIRKRFIRAYAENADTAMKILFYVRDVRGGLGERRFFRVALKFLCENHAESVIKNLEWIAEYGRYDDFLALMDTPCEAAAIAFLKKQLDRDICCLMNDEKNISLLAKWLPSINTSSKDKVRLGRKLAKAFGMSEKEYRKTLSALRKEIDIIENYLRETDYSFDYEKQPGKALLKYRRAFNSHDAERYSEFLNKVKKHEAVMHTEALMPYEIIRPFYGYDRWFHRISDEDARALDITWNALPDYTDNSNSLVVIDTSGSMLWGDPSALPMTVATSLGLYFAERNTGEFANHFILFSETPKLIEIKGSTLQDKLEYIATYNEVADTDLQKVFELILSAAINKKAGPEDMPERIYIISDMEFNDCVAGADMTNFEYAKKIFEEAGYKLPKVIFWNAASRTQQLPVTKNEQGVTLVSGCNARLFRQVISDNVDPYVFMMEIVGSARYEKIVA